MKVIMVLFDSLNRNFLEPYGCKETITPNFKRLSEKSVTFDTCYAGSLPCIPARRELHTSRYNFLHRCWGPIEPFDDSFTEILKTNKVYSHLISDHFHYIQDGGATYNHRYSSFEIVRGQEGDKWKASVEDPVIPEHIGNCWRQDVVNREYMKTEDKHPLNQIFTLGIEFLEKNKNADNWFLQLETYDPHEPYFTYEKYRELYPHKYSGPHYDWPQYKKVDESEEYVNHIRCEYSALLSMCDNYLGKLLDYMDNNNMWKDTMLIVNTDHGFLLGEHDCYAKNIHPQYEEISHIPLFIWNPKKKIANERRKSLVQTMDLSVTILDFFNIEKTKDMEGHSLNQVIENDNPVREYALFGIHGREVYITDGHYVYRRGYNKINRPIFNYTQIPTHMDQLFSIKEMKTAKLHKGFKFTKETPVMQIESFNRIEREGNSLYDLYKDPKQENPIDDKEIENTMIKNMILLMIKNDAPEEQYERLNLKKEYEEIKMEL